MPTITVTRCEFAFLKIELVSQSAETLDLLTWRQMLTLALERDQGVFGSSAHIDIIHQTMIEGKDTVILRIPNVNKAAAWNAISSWSDQERRLKVVSVSDYLAPLVGPCQ